MKKIIMFVIILFFWLIGGIIFKFDKDYYELLKLPLFILSPTFISIIWLILYSLISISVFKIVNFVNIFKYSDYYYILITNYFGNTLFPFVFFYLKSPFFAFIITLIVFISSILLFIETRRISNKSSVYLIPYVVFNAYSLIISFLVYIMNF